MQAKQEAVVRSSEGLIPMPQHLQQLPGTFTLSASTILEVKNNSPEERQVATFLSQSFKETVGSSLAVKTKGKPVEGAISLTIDSTLALGQEGYQLTIQPTGIVCSAKTQGGLFWAVQTLRQLVALQPVHGVSKKVLLPSLAITDEPAYAWRGLLLDVSRHFMSKEFIKRYLDLLSFYKLNILHLHLSDDQGWRLPIPGYSRLTQVGAWRKEEDGSTHGGFYMATEVQELVAYAQSRNITIIPEIDVPGHVQAALAAYPELSCTGGPFQVSNKAGVHSDILCAGNEQTYTFLTSVFQEVARLFPGQYVHVGGDEAPKTRWRSCPKCQERMKAEGLPDEEALQAYFTRRVAAIVAPLGKKVIVWDEALKGGIASGTLVQSWHGAGAVREATRQHGQVIVSPRSSFYLDLNSGITPLEKVYNTPLVPTGLSVQQENLIKGAEAALWTETIPQEKVDAMVFPRLLAFSENLWRHQNKPTFDNFSNRLNAHYSVLEKQGVTYGFETWPVTVLPAYIPATGAFAVRLQAGLPSTELRYTLDNSLPSYASALYTGKAIGFTSSVTLKVTPFKNGKPYSEPVEAVFVKHKAVYKEPKLTHPFHGSYQGSGAMALTDGILGDADYRKGFWQGFEKQDLEAILDLGQEQTVTKVTTRFLQDANSWIFLPTRVEVWVAGSNQKYAKAGVLSHLVPLTLEKPVIQSFTQALDETPVRYVKVIAKNIGVCPPGHPGAGGSAFLMADEIIVH
ncbi:family 20 glycosylhydrolase [Nibribacter ruber]|uniref:beta-N-acetylhexosaminidase n=1 Tax=Nibribacter ruber TaxID=2698458 RepID=A0A6P1P007_9BACT|nr:family 20 glycosylhydrolase [Nibribacter ruber]QHL87598.1 family 20 glycosylhydrolase [Nibribacter ruber]